MTDNSVSKKNEDANSNRVSVSSQDKAIRSAQEGTGVKGVARAAGAYAGGVAEAAADFVGESSAKSSSKANGNQGAGSAAKDAHTAEGKAKKHPFGRGPKSPRKGEDKKYHRHEKEGLSFTTHVTFAFLAITVITSLTACAVLSFVWEQHFQSYTRENMERLADATASNIAVAYNHTGDWYGGALAAAASASSLYDTVFIQVVDSKGNILYDDGTKNGVDSVKKLRAEGRNTASAPIKVDGYQVGTVYVRVFGSDTLLTQPDQEFREKSYQAIAMAFLLAGLVAIVGGTLYARVLVRPINRITVAARALRDGDFSARTNMQEKDEISRLGHTFDQMAESIEKSRQLERRLVTDVAHELRTPLMAIQSTVEAMIDGVFEPDEERLETLNAEVCRLSRLVDALLKLSRLENRTTPMELSKVDLVEVMDGLVSNHQAYVSDVGLTLKYEHDTHVYVMGNTDFLRQAAANLISNAIRYTPEGGTITVSVRKGDIMGTIAVRDTGIGLTSEEAKMVFSRFWRADSGRARETGGLGIGLSVVKEIVDQHKGWIQVEGKPDEGACFTMYIPLYKEETPRKGFSLH